MTDSIIVTGGAGFIGSHLVELLLQRKHTVVVIDNLSTGSVRNIQHLRDHPRLKVHEGDAGCPEVVNRYADGAAMIYHLAAAVGVRLITTRPRHSLTKSLRSTEVVLDVASRKRIPVFLASSSEVYGSFAHQAHAEDSPLAIGRSDIARWSYASGKLFQECLAFSYMREQGLPITVGRFFNIVGPRQSAEYGMVLPSMVRQALSGNPITVHGDGTQRRSFMDVGHAVRALHRLMRTNNAVGEIVNIGDDKEVTIRELARLVKETTGSASEIHYVPYNRVYSSFEDVTRRFPDLRKLRRLVGPLPGTELHSVIRQVIEFEQNILKDACTDCPIAMTA